MKNLIVGSTLALGLLFGPFAQAEYQAISVGYAHIKLQQEKALKGATLNYRYELNNEWGILSSFTLAKGDREENEEAYKAKFNYYSSMIGPTYRINEYISMYGQAGIASLKGKFTEEDDDSATEQSNLSKSALAWGTGFIINPVENFAVTIGYEGSHFNFNTEGKVSTNGFNIGFGYRF
ncbi:Ail/Lom family outer membrane beta-barrel protein [Xenorhabdus griffiniae]|uniref:Ail/Lom family outer membrane beta-barrel protein n=1 Tax=Xenorhabdus griffiniae TaxID=351672 RepID=UPI00235A2EBC|nr:Ail/Lom family outer membrane beta-barrel protein [Xenorhabdus griffiniae]MDC9606935.1 Ail/Lom family outer membrane beta-barrel protein [Xenorhabdus griffiniae]